MSVYLCIDVGSQSLRASLIDHAGAFICKYQTALRAPDAPNPGWAEHRAEYFWQIFGETVQQAARYATDHQLTINAMGVTCQRASVVNLDKNGVPLRPVILWSDRRRAKNVQAVGGLTGLGMRLIGVHETVQHFQAEAEINWLAYHQPEIWEATDKLLFLSGYFNYRLTGKYIDSLASQVGYVPLDYKKQTWARASKWHWRALRGVHRSQLPELARPGDVLGQLTAHVAQELNLPAGLPVIACATDKACEALGSGCIADSQACLSFGTAATVNVTLPRYKEVERFVPPYPAALPGKYLSETQIYRGFWLVSWFKKEFALTQTESDANDQTPVEQTLDQLLEQTPAGALGLTAQPYWSPGVRFPGPEARGALIGFNETHTHAHIYRALLEGLIFSLKEGLQRITKATGKPVSQIRVAGGGSQSDQILQMTADIFDLPVERNRAYEASSVGVAICCAVAMKHYDSFNNAVAHMTGTGREFQPQPGTAQLYQKLFQDVYCKTYNRVKPLYKSIMNIHQQ